MAMTTKEIKAKIDEWKARPHHTLECECPYCAVKQLWEWNSEIVDECYSFSMEELQGLLRELWERGGDDEDENDIKRAVKSAILSIEVDAKMAMKKVEQAKLAVKIAKRKGGK